MIKCGWYWQVVLVDYVPGSFGQLLLWSFSDMGNGFGCICVANNTTLILEVNLSIKLVVRTSAAAPSQLWKISPQFGSVSCKAYSSQALSIKDGNLKLGLADSKDATQVYIHYLYYMCVVLEFMFLGRYVLESFTLIVEPGSLLIYMSCVHINAAMGQNF